MNHFRNILLLFMLVVMLVCVGCDKQQEGNNNPPGNSQTENTGTLDSVENSKEKEPDIPPTPPQHKVDGQNNKSESRHSKEMKIKVYYPDESGLRLIGVNREIEVNNTNDKYKAAVAAVMTPPTEKNLTSTVSNNSSLISVEVKNGTAVVNFDKKIKNGFSGGSTGEEFLIGSVVNTLTEFKEVQNVKFLIDGNEIETLSGHMDLSEPVERMNNLMNK